MSTLSCRSRSVRGPARLPQGNRRRCRALPECAFASFSGLAIEQEYAAAKTYHHVMCRNPPLWTPSSTSGFSVESRLDREDIIMGQGPAPPNPFMVERFQSVVSSLFQQRIVRCGGAVDDDMANLIVAQLLYLDAQDPKKDVTLYINSPGGSVTAGMAVFDTMRHVRPDVSTVCVGLAASMGAFLLSAGEQGKRYSLANSRIMIHQPLGGAQGQAADVEIQANEILHHKLTLNGYLSEFTGQSMEQMTKDTDRDFFMSPQECVEYGLIDAVITKPTLAALGAM